MGCLCQNVKNPDLKMPPFALFVTYVRYVLSRIGREMFGNTNKVRFSRLDLTINLKLKGLFYSQSPLR